MSKGEHILRVILGLSMTTVLVIGGFGIVLHFIPTWGATPQEITRVLPGDELLSDANINWTHAITIDAPVQDVWGWIAQLGERRGAFYSYTLIENQMGNGNVYHNADRVVPEWQNPGPGDAIIGGAVPMQIRAVEKGKQLIAYSDGDLKWLWGWFLEPLDQNRTRLVVRMKIQTPAGMDNSPAGTFVGLGGFVMERAMLQGIQTRAEGNIPPPYTETLEMALWILALAAAVTAGVFFIMFRQWVLPLTAGLLALLALFVFTFVQPPIWVRAFADIALYAILAGIILNQFLSRSLHRVSRGGGKSLKLKPI